MHTIKQFFFNLCAGRNKKRKNNEWFFPFNLLPGSLSHLLIFIPNNINPISKNGTYISMISNTGITGPGKTAIGRMGFGQQLMSGIKKINAYLVGGYFTVTLNEMCRSKAFIYCGGECSTQAYQSKYNQNHSKLFHFCMGLNVLYKKKELSETATQQNGN
jgi:hypothetical protein